MRNIPRQPLAHTDEKMLYSTLIHCSSCGKYFGHLVYVSSTSGDDVFYDPNFPATNCWACVREVKEFVHVKLNKNGTNPYYCPPNLECLEVLDLALEKTVYFGQPISTFDIPFQELPQTSKSGLGELPSNNLTGVRESDEDLFIVINWNSNVVQN